MVSNFYPVWKCSGFQDFLLIQIKLYLKKNDCDLPKQSDICRQFYSFKYLSDKTMYTKNEKENH